MYSTTLVCWNRCVWMNHKRVKSKYYFVPSTLRNYLLIIITKAPVFLWCWSGHVKGTLLPCTNNFSTRFFKAKSFVCLQAIEVECNISSLSCYSILRHYTVTLDIFNTVAWYIYSIGQTYLVYLKNHVNRTSQNSLGLQTNNEFIVQISIVWLPVFNHLWVQTNFHGTSSLLCLITPFQTHSIHTTKSRLYERRLSKLTVVRVIHWSLSQFFS